MDTSKLELPTIPSPPVPDEQFNLFHSIDRALYARLIIGLGRDPTESMHVMGFWLWLEQDLARDHKIVDRMLSLSLSLISGIADETVLCVRLIESDTFVPQDGVLELPLLQQVVGIPLSFKLFHDNRLTVLRGVSRMINEVCIRAFRDILQEATERKALVQIPKRIDATRNGTGSRQMGRVNIAPSPLANTAQHGVDSVGQVESIPRRSVNQLADATQVGTGGVGQVENIPGQTIIIGNHEIPNPYYQAPGVLGPVGYQGAAFNAPMTIYSVGTVQLGYPEAQGQYTGSEVIDMNGDNLGFMEEEEDDIMSPDKRTIFLTFSKGYPITENEVWEFFTWKFGDFIEAIHMQEVEEGQPLYARVVAKTGADMDRVVAGGKAKYHINGKHVWARRFIRKQRSPTDPTE